MNKTGSRLITYVVLGIVVVLVGYNVLFGTGEVVAVQ